MKLIQLLEAVDWNTKPEKQQITMVKRNGFNIKKITNPSEAVQIAAVTNNGNAIHTIINMGIIPKEAVQLAAVKQNPHMIRSLENPSEAVQMVVAGDAYASWLVTYIHNPSPLAIRTSLTNQQFINAQSAYEEAVKVIFKDNNILMKKWLRYGENMRTRK